MKTQSLAIAGISALVGMLAVATPASSKTVNITVVGGPPPAVTFVGAFKDIVSVKINERLKAEGHDLQIQWNHAYAQSLAKFNEVFEAVEEGTDSYIDIWQASFSLCDGQATQGQGWAGH